MLLLIEYISNYIDDEFKWSEVTGQHPDSLEKKTQAQKEYLRRVNLVRRLQSMEVVALFKKMKRHHRSTYWNHYLLFRYFLTHEQQVELLAELTQEERPQDAKALIEEMGKWSPDFQRHFLSNLESPLRNKLFQAFGPMELLELSVSLTTAIREHPHTFCERYT